MKHIANLALNACSTRGASYADVRVIVHRSRALTTKNGKVGSASDSESVGMNVRVIADGAWGFAASSELGRGAVEATAAAAVEIARASARVKKADVQLATEKPAVAEWSTPYQIDPFMVSVEQNIELLLKVDAQLRSVAGITLWGYVVGSTWVNGSGLIQPNGTPRPAMTPKGALSESRAAGLSAASGRAHRRWTLAATATRARRRR